MIIKIYFIRSIIKNTKYKINDKNYNYIYLTCNELYKNDICS